MKEELLRNYAELIVKVGVNLKEGQYVTISSKVDDEYFTKLVVEEAYKAGAKSVRVDWYSEAISRLNYEFVEKETLAETRKYELEKWEFDKDTLPCRIFIESDDPDNLKGIDPEKIVYVNSKRRAAIYPIREKMEYKYQWTICAIPSKKWAQKLFPNDDIEVAFEKLWDAIIKTTRIEGNAVENWNNHNKFIHEKCAYLNNLGIKSLHYNSKNGTDFDISLIDGVNFCGAQEVTLSGNTFNPNMPTEECFTSPLKSSANGKVFASKPLCLNGVVLKDFGFEFKNGKVVNVMANDEVTKVSLEKWIKTDENACMLGEVALVPFDSPVNKTGILFYNTLFDENACCHLALGRGFQDTIKDFREKTKEELDSYPINNSVIHTDFMIGTEDLSIVATLKDGSKVQIFKDGTWAI